MRSGGTLLSSKSNDFGAGSSLAYASGPPAPNSSDGYVVSKQEYDAAGRMYKQTDNKLHVTQFAFDALGRGGKLVQVGVNAPRQRQVENDRPG